jgi:non-homologous end joining protein Ku
MNKITPEEAKKDLEFVNKMEKDFDIKYISDELREIYQKCIKQKLEYDFDSKIFSKHFTL